VKLLRVLQEREFERLGSTETTRANIRLVAATNKDLRRRSRRRNSARTLLPAQRLRDLRAAAARAQARHPSARDHFVEKFSREHGKKVKRISTPAIDMLASYHWPGNVRELANAIERATVVCDGRCCTRIICRRRCRRPKRPARADRLAERRAGSVREGRAAGRVEECPREPGQGRPAAGHNRADLQLPRAEIRHRLAAVQELTTDNA
jgi:DNA-binding NtrC family response regulator